MIEKILEKVLDAMTPHLDDEQIEKLNNVLYLNFHGVSNTGLYSEIDFKTLVVGQQVRPDKLNTLIDVDITDLYNKRMSGKKSIYEVPYTSYIENPVQMCWYYYIGSGRKIFRYAVTRESDLHSAINLNLAILYRDIS